MNIRDIENWTQSYVDSTYYNNLLSALCNFVGNLTNDQNSEISILSLSTCIWLISLLEIVIFLIIVDTLILY